MARMREMLEDEALDFVLKGGQPDADRDGQSGLEDISATIRGDLSSVNLPDIFQTITISSMEGTLRITSGWEPTYVHAEDGKLRVLPPQELQIRRLGYRLLASGLMDAKEIRQAFIKQKREGGDVGQILEATGKIEKLQFDAIRLALEEDFLLELFTLRRGQFAFFKESYPVPGLEERFQQCVPFEAEQVLLEIARRGDEWEVIFAILGDLDEIPIQTGDPQATPFSDIEQELYNQVDGKKSLRDIAGGMLDSLFEAAKAAKLLHESGAIAKAPSYHLLGLARTALASQQQQQAWQYLSLVRENRTTSLDEKEEIADLLVVAGDPKAGAEILATGAKETDDPERRLRILHRAKDLDGLNRAVLEMLVDALRDPNALEQSTEFQEAALQLSEICTDEEDYERALGLIEELEAERINDLALVSRKAKILLKMDRAPEAFASMTELAKTFRLQKDTANLIKTLEQILRLDPRDAKARSELKSLLEGKGIKRVRMLLAALAFVAVARVGGGMLATFLAERSGRSSLTEAAEMFETGKLDEAHELAKTVSDRLGNESPVGKDAGTLLAKIKTRRVELQSQEAARTLNELYAGIDRAVNELDKRDLSKALAIYDELLVKYGETTDHKSRIEQSLSVRFKSLLEGLVEQLESVESDPIPVIEDTESPKARLALFAKLEGLFPQASLDRMQRFAERLRDKSSETPATKRLPKGALGVVERYLKVGRQTHAKRITLAAKIEDDKKKIALNEPFLKAREAERRFDFHEAFRQFDKVVREYKGDETTEYEFRKKRDYFKALTDELDKLSAATSRGDFKVAMQTYRSLRRTHPKIPFGQFVELPLNIDTAPTGATVYDGDKAAGETPLLYRYKPNDIPTLRVELAGFGPVDIPEKSVQRGHFAAILEAHDIGKLKLKGSLTSAVRYSPSQKVWVATDRSGTVSAVTLGATPQLRFQKKFADVSGDLGGPTVIGDRCILPGRSGRVRCIDLTSGEIDWEKDIGKRLLSPAIAAGRNVWIASDDGELFLVSMRGDVVDQFRPAGELRHPPVAGTGGRFFVTDRRGTVVCYDNRGKILWREKIDRAGWIRPSLAGDVLLVPTEAAQLAVLSAGNGTVRDTISLGHMLRVSPIADGAHVFGATAKHLLKIDLQSGAIEKRTRLAAPPKGPLAAIAGSVCLSLERRGFMAFRTSDLEPHCRLAVGQTSELPLIRAGSRVVLQESKGELRWYDLAVLKPR